MTIVTNLDIPPARLPWADLAWGPPAPGPARDAARAALAELELAGAATRLDGLWAAADAAAAVAAGGGGGGVVGPGSIQGLVTGEELAARAARAREEGVSRGA